MHPFRFFLDQCARRDKEAVVTPPGSASLLSADVNFLTYWAAWHYPGAMSDAPPLALMLTALTVEYQAVRSHITDVETLVHRHGTIVEQGLLPGTSWRVALVEAGEGSLGAAALTTRMVEWLAPQAAFFSSEWRGD
ncbi:hypothetical protein GCM10020295_42270 [Streptomyces cinereospinus]